MDSSLPKSKLTNGAPLGILDQSPIVRGTEAQTAIANTIALAQTADRLNYARYWVAEHHNTAAFAGAAPEILITHLAAKTHNIRIGSGGIMLPHYSPLKIAEQFRMLGTLAPNRIDLGIGRAPGGDPKTAAALQPGPKAWPPDVFPQQLELLLQFLEDAEGKESFPPDHPYQGIHAQPIGGDSPPIWMLGSGGDGAIHAAQNGLPFVYAHFITPTPSPHAVETYRKLFKPSKYLDKPKTMVALSALAADTDENAQKASAARDMWVMQMMQNRAGYIPNQQDVDDFKPSADEANTLKAIRDRSLVGTTDRIADGLNEIIDTYQADELMLLTITHDHNARIASYQHIAKALLM